MINLTQPNLILTLCETIYKVDHDQIEFHNSNILNTFWNASQFLSADQH
jgi:hypothetical protein